MVRETRQLRLWIVLDLGSRPAASLAAQLAIAEIAEAIQELNSFEEEEQGLLGEEKTSLSMDIQYWSYVDGLKRPLSSRTSK